MPFVNPISTIRLTGALALVMILGSALAAGEVPQQGIVKRVDAAKGTITLTVGGKDLDYSVTDKTRYIDITANPIKQRLSAPGFKAGSMVMFQVVDHKAGNPVLAILSIGQGTADASKLAPPAKVDMSKLKPLTDMGKEDSYKGYKGGLYPGGGNQRPAAHEAAGLALAKQIQPLDAGGKPDPNGKIVLMSVGMSNTQQAFNGFLEVVRDERKDLNPRLVLVNGAQGGMTAKVIQSADGGRSYGNGQRVKYWEESGNRLKRAGVTPAQVQVIWVKQANGNPTEPFPEHAQLLQAQMAKILHVVHQRYPNVKLAYLSSRTSAAFAKSKLNPEPYAYEGGFAINWLIEQQIKGDPALNYDPAKGEVKSPWLSWGPYLWTAGSDKRADGFFYAEDDYRQDDRTHPSLSGQLKIGGLLLQFLKTDTTTRGWFLATSQ